MQASDKNKKTDYGFYQNILRMTFMKISKTKKSPQNSQNVTILKISMSCKEASNKKVQKRNCSWNWKILE